VGRRNTPVREVAVRERLFALPPDSVRPPAHPPPPSLPGASPSVAPRRAPFLSPPRMAATVASFLLRSGTRSNPTLG
jgi:hypothetical protein